MQLEEVLLRALTTKYGNIETEDYESMGQLIRSHPAGNLSGYGNLIIFKEWGLIVHDKGNWFCVKKLKDWEERIKQLKPTLKNLGLMALLPTYDND